MNKRKGKMAELCEKRDDIKVKALFETMYGYYQIADIDMGCIYSQVFKLLYLNDEKLTYEQVAIKSNIGNNTLDRYIKKFDSLAEKLSQK